MHRLMAVGLVLVLSGVAAADLVYYSADGFESYNYGPVNGQGTAPNVPAGWQDTSSPPANMAVIADGPDLAFGKSLRLQVPNTQNNTSAAQVLFTDDLRQLAGTVTVEFSVYRQRDLWASDFWFAPLGQNQAAGLQWDQGTGISKTLPLGFVGGGADTVMNATVPVKIVYDFTGPSPVAQGFYNGALVASVTYNDPNAPFNTFTGWTFSLQHDEPSAGSDTEVLWVDNFHVLFTPVPEPAALLLMAACAALRRR